VASRVEPRRVPLDNVFNLRDLGGYPGLDGRRVVDGRLYRADGLNRLSEADAAVVKQLGIRTVVDLRTIGERERWGSAPTHLFDATALHLPILSELWPLYEETDDHDPVAYLIERYHEMTIEGAASLATLLDLLADDPDAVPLVFHCSAGKDRTGVTAAVVLGLLGVADDQIAADYAHTSIAMDDLVAWVRAQNPESADSMVDQPKTFLACPEEAMSGFLAELSERFGSIEAYVGSIGVSGPTIDRLRSNFLV
jgi:protein tyrosine/serine phosphatase